MKHLIKSYFRFLWNSSNAHGVHSPFVFNLVTKCFYDKRKYSEYKILDDYRNSLLENKEVIEVTDFGAGSRVFKSNKRAVNQIAKNAGISAKRAKLLFRLLHYFQPKKVLEIGTSLGLATSALALNNFSSLTTLEGCPNTLKQCQLQFKKFKINNVNFINTEFSEQLSKYKSTSFDFIYFDGNHSKAATLNYFTTLLPTAHNDSVWIFDDIHWSVQMEEAWEVIKNHPQVTVCIDTFQWGFVFFRKEQEQENFIIRVDQSFFLDAVLGIKSLWGLIK